MPKDFLTDAEVELEIHRLQQSEFVRLTEKEIRLKNKRRKYLADLKWKEKHGRHLAAQGYTLENMEARLFPEEEI